MSMLAQFKREMIAFFYSPIAYVILVGAMVINGGVFLAIVNYLSQPDAPPTAAMQMMFGGTIFFWILVITATPLITMRLVAEERHTGTLESLLTAPVSDAGVILVKYAAAVVFYAAIWAPSIAYPLLLSKYAPVDIGPILAGYLGALIIGMLFLAFGLFFSTLTKNQIISAVLTFAINMVFFFISLFEAITPSGDPKSALSYMNLFTHMQDFGRGIVDSRPVIYCLSLTIFVLFCTVQALQTRRWRG